MSHCKPYPAYKDSGIEWLGQVPKHWEVRSIKRLGSLSTGSTPSTDDPDNYSDDGYYWIRPEDLDETGKPVKATKYLSEKGWQLVRKVEKGSTLICCIGTVGKAGYLNELASTNQQITAIKFKSNDKYFFYVTLAAKQALAASAVGNVIRILNSDRLGAILVPCPSSEEQFTIAAYLDRETARIDAIVNAKTRFIELLREKRQALITHAVTKGLDHNVKMKDSGMEWLGQVPNHWQVMPLKYIGSAIIGLTYSPEDVVDQGEGTLVLRSSNIQSGKIVFGDNVYVKTRIPNKLITKKGDILICSRNGSRALIGKNGVIDENSVGMSFGAFTTIFRTKFNKFVYYVLNSSLFQFQSSRFITTTINQLTTETLNSFEIPVPPFDEQVEIAAYLERATTRIDALITKTERSIELLKECRTALITAAVTGQIDLREVKE